MSIDDWSTQRLGLRQVAEARLRDLSAPPSVASLVGVDALALLYRLASTPERAAEALKLLHELQVHQVELDLLHAELEASQPAIADDLARYKGVFDVAPIGCFILDFGGAILEANMAGAALLGVATEDVSGSALERFLTPGSWPVIESLLVEYRDGGTDSSVEVQVTVGGREPGTEVVSLTARLLPDGTSILLVVTG